VLTSGAIRLRVALSVSGVIARGIARIAFA
jgi:hypothetical protein